LSGFPAAMALETRVRDHAGTRAARGGLVATTDDRGGALDTTRLDTADGDDIVVVVGGAGAAGGDYERPGRVRRVVVGTAIVAVLVSGGAIAVAARHDGSTTRVRTTSPSTVPAAPVGVKGR